MSPPARSKDGPPTRITPALLRRWPLPEINGELGKEGRGRVLVVTIAPGAVRGSREPLEQLLVLP